MNSTFWLVSSLFANFALAFILLIVKCQFGQIRKGLLILDKMNELKFLPGRQILKSLEASGVNMSYGTFYSLCGRLTEAGCVETQREKDQDGPYRTFRPRPGAQMIWVRRQFDL